MIIKNLIYILQANLYDASKFLKFAYTHWQWWKLEKRAKLIWTKKAGLIYALTVIMYFVFLWQCFVLFGAWGFIFLLIFISLLPLYIIFALWLIEPVDNFLKERIFQKAKKIFKKNKKNIIVIGITGSYGKTTTKEILATILQEKFQVMKLSENINTDIGIADFILKNAKIFQKKAIFIVEMGAYKKGEIKRICDLVSPDYAMLTGINESHLERFGSLENTVEAKFELPLSAKKMAILNFDDENIYKNYKQFDLPKIIGVSKEETKNIKSLENFGGLEFKFNDTIFRTKLLAVHNISLILLASRMAQEFGLSLLEISHEVKKIKHIPHRLELIYNELTKVFVIDDSYNGNFNGIVSGIAVLKTAIGRKIVLTPGLVELGKRTQEIHEKIGQLYAENKIDLVLLIKSPASDYIISGLKSKNFKNYKLYKSSQEAHNDLANVIKSGDTIIFQNDLPDNYF